MNNYSEFINAIEGYYGSYKPVVKKLLYAYLKKNCKSVHLKQLFEIVVKSYTNTYKMPPDIAIMEKFLCDKNYDKHFVTIREPSRQIEYKQGYVSGDDKVNNEFDKIREKLKFKNE